METHDIRRDFGATWRERLAEARERAAAGGPQLSAEHIADLRRTVAELEVSSPENMALLWSGRDILTWEPLDASDPNGKRWWDKLAPRDAEVFSKLNLARRLEDTPAGQFLADARLNYAEGDPPSAVARELWETMSTRFVGAASGRIEIIAADVEATPHEREAALDDYREIQLWYEQDFFERLGRQREHPALPEDVASAPDRSMAANAWKYSAEWRAFIRSE